LQPLSQSRVHGRRRTAGGGILFFDQNHFAAGNPHILGRLDTETDLGSVNLENGNLDAIPDANRLAAAA
jgi:hypothetical protein